MIGFLKGRTGLAIALVALLQTGVLASMVVDRVRILKADREITLPVIPVDPRDPFRGDFVRLGYEPTTVPMKLLEGPRPADGASFYVTLQQQADGSWRTLKLTSAKPADAGADRVVLLGRVDRDRPLSKVAADGSVSVRYGLERYYVGEGQGGSLETLAREKKLAARIAVDSRGRTAIKGLVVDGVPRFEDTPF